MRYLLGINLPLPSTFLEMCESTHVIFELEPSVIPLLTNEGKSEFPDIPIILDNTITSAELKKNYTPEIKGIIISKISQLIKIKARKSLVDFLIFILNNSNVCFISNIEKFCNYLCGLCIGKGCIIKEEKILEIQNVEEFKSYPKLLEKEFKVLSSSEHLSYIISFCNLRFLSNIINFNIISIVSLFDISKISDQAFSEEFLLSGKQSKSFAKIVSQISSFTSKRVNPAAPTDKLSTDQLKNIIQAYSELLSFIEWSTKSFYDSFCGNEISQISKVNESIIKSYLSTIIKGMFATLMNIDEVYKSIKENLMKASIISETDENSIKDILEFTNKSEINLSIQEDNQIIKDLIVFIEARMIYELSISLMAISKIAEEKVNPKDKKKKYTPSQGIITLVEKIKNETLEKNPFSNFSDLMKFLLNSKMTKMIYESINETLEGHNIITRKPKIPKGTRDSDPYQMSIKSKCMDKIKAIFKIHGAIEIDTPVFELKETLMGKYGEESKLIYDLDDQGGELLSLRYDLTVPLARYMALNNLASIKRYHIAKVYRREAIHMTKGRYRELYQCDYDIAGKYDSYLPEVEIVYLMNEVLSSLNIGKFKILVNHRVLLNEMVLLSGCDKNLFKKICSAIDKLDKSPWEEVEKELISKGVSEAQAKSIKNFVSFKGDPKLIYKNLIESKLFEKSEEAIKTLKDIEWLFTRLEELNSLGNVEFDLSLARGLDYYTGLIFEAKLVNSEYTFSIAGGGRYDNLVGMFSGKQIPAIGVSFGLERILNILEEKLKGSNPCPTQVLVSSVGKNMVAHRLELCKILWNAGIAAETLYVDSPKPQKQLSYALDNQIPIIIWIGEDEIKEGVVTIKELSSKSESKVLRAEMIYRLTKILNNL